VNRVGNWRPHEDDVIKAMWKVRPTVPTDAIAAQLDGRSPSAVINRANKLQLGYRCPRGCSGQTETTAETETKETPLTIETLTELPPDVTAHPVHYEPLVALMPSPVHQLSSPPKGLCCWPLWRDKPTHTYCGKRRQEGKVYCAEHAKLAYVRLVPRNNAA
jgi:hypothetical protein